MKKKRVIISVTSDLATDHRVQKVATTLHQNGFDILLVGRRKHDSLPFNAPYPYRRMRLLFNHTFFFYAEYNIRLFFFLLFNRADILLANDLDTLLANFCAAKLRHRTLIYDAHELFTEVPELNGRSIVKAIWLAIERICLPRTDKCYTVCQTIANYYNSKYNLHMQVVRNVPIELPNRTNDTKLSFPGKKIILYQGALNIGRGIEWIISAMPYIGGAVLVIIGNGDISNELKMQVKRMNLQEKVFFIGSIACEELPLYTIAADLGLCLLKNTSLSYFYSLPNRIFDYMYSYVPVLASDFPEISQIVEKYNIGRTIRHYEPKYLAAVIKEMFEQKIEKKAFDQAIKDNCWENEQAVLLDIFK